MCSSNFTQPIISLYLATHPQNLATHLVLLSHPSSKLSHAHSSRFTQPPIFRSYPPILRSQPLIQLFLATHLCRTLPLNRCTHLCLRTYPLISLHYATHLTTVYSVFHLSQWMAHCTKYITSTLAYFLNNFYTEDGAHILFMVNLNYCTVYSILLPVKRILCILVN